MFTAVRFTSRSWFIVLLALTPSLLQGQNRPRLQDELAGMSRARLERIRPAMRAYVDSGKVAGVVTILMRRGRVVALDTAGWADLEAHVPARPNTIFRIASMTKAITSVAVMSLVEDGRLLLSDPVAKYLPAFQNMRVIVSRGDSAKGLKDSLVAAARLITVRDLLTHRTGIAYAFDDDAPNVGYYRRARVPDGITPGPGTIAQTADLIAAQPLAFEPGSKWRYGLNADVLGRLVEVVSGRPLDQFLAERIFRPLHMHDTFFYVPDARLASVAVPYTLGQSGRLQPMDSVQWIGSFEVAGRGSRGSRTYFSGGAGLYSTAPDYARFLQMLLNGGELGGVRVLSPKTVELMTASATGDLSPSPTGPGTGFGLGFAIVNDLGLSGGLGSVGQYSWGGAYGSTFWVDPKEQLIGVMMIQLIPRPGVDIGERFQTLAYQAIVR
jgi:CubicO group peptidase (beta-lactamase class C family)